MRFTSQLGKTNATPLMKIAVTLVCILVLLSILVAIPTLQNVGGSEFDSENAFSFAKVTREIIIVLIFILSLVICNSIFYYSVIFFLIILVTSQIFSRTDYVYSYGILSEMRLVFVWASGIIIYCSHRRDSTFTINSFLMTTKIYILFNLFACAYQILYFPAVKGATFLGARAFGFSQNPILMSQTCAAALLCIICFEKRKGSIVVWSFMCMFMALSTGGRSGMIGCFAIFLTWYVGQLRTSNEIKNYLIYFVLTLMPFVFIFISDETFSGRSGTMESGINDGRLYIWSYLFDKYVFESASSLIFGYAPGMGTNSLYSISLGSYSGNFIPVVADSFFMTVFLSSGLIGFLLLISVLYVVFAKNLVFNRIPILVGGLALSIAQNIPEIHPANIFLASAIGAASVRQTKSRQGFARSRSVRDVQK